MQLSVYWGLSCLASSELRIIDEGGLPEQRLVPGSGQATV